MLFGMKLKPLMLLEITWMDKSNNKMADLLENVAVKPNDDSFIGISTVEVQSRPSIPNNIENW